MIRKFLKELSGLLLNLVITDQIMLLIPVKPGPLMAANQLALPQLNPAKKDGQVANRQVRPGPVIHDARLCHGIYLVSENEGPGSNT